ncbi:phosphoribosylanthranilate isomerase [Sorangium sp. So ce1014]|uniref:phosphoribosylanthranilate isomerase n=1 Tax=Sorangium sp. So ce1014 TaxID=3133326 RepID=UPI003F6320EF
MSPMWDAAVPYTRIKLCEFEALDPAVEASHLGADALGFHLFRHQDVDEKVARFRQIFRYLPAGVDKVLLTDLDAELLVGILGSLPVDTVQLYPDWSPAQIVALRARVRPGLRILKVLSAQPEENVIPDHGELVRMYGAVVEGFLLDSYRVGGTGKTADWDRCAAVVRATPLPLFLAGGLTMANVAEAIRRVRPFGVDVETGVSDRIPNGPLVKNMAKCARFIDAVRRADTAHLPYQATAP